MDMMKYTPLLVSALFTAGCGPQPIGGPPEPASISQQKAAWERARSKNPGGLLVIGLRADRGRWEVLGPSMDWYPDLTRGPEYYVRDAKSAESRARGSVADPSLKIAAVVGLADPPNDAPVAWYWAENGAVKESKTAPSVDLSHGAAEFVHQLRGG